MNIKSRPNHKIYIQVLRRMSPEKMKRVLMPMLIALSLFASGCEHDGEDSTSLAGTDWRLQAWSVSSLDASHFTITATFDDSRISGTTAINSYSGAYSATTGGDFSVGTLYMTEMAGSDDEMRAERLYFELLEQARRYTVNETTLTLFDGGSNELLVFTKR